MILMNISYMFQTKSLKNCIVIFNLLTASGHWQSWTCHDHEACVDSLEHSFEFIFQLGDFLYV